MSMNSPPHKKDVFFCDLLGIMIFSRTLFFGVQPFCLETYVPDSGPAAAFLQNRNKTDNVRVRVT
jgi:hypothetical protein